MIVRNTCECLFVRCAAALFIFSLWSGSVYADEIKMNVNQSVFDKVLAAAFSGDIQKLDSFALSGELDTLDEQGLSAVLHTVMRERLDATQLLIRVGANVDIYEPALSKDVIDQTAFLYAGATGNDEALEILIKAGAQADIYNYYGGTALIPAAEKGHASTVKLLLEKSNVDVNHVNKLGWTALMEAVVLSNGGPVHQQIAELLLIHGADAGIADRDGVTALQHAKAMGFPELVQLLNLYVQ